MISDDKGKGIVSVTLYYVSLYTLYNSVTE